MMARKGCDASKYRRAFPISKHRWSAKEIALSFQLHDLGWTKRSEKYTPPNGTEIVVHKWSHDWNSTTSLRLSTIAAYKHVIRQTPERRLPAAFEKALGIGVDNAPDAGAMATVPSSMAIEFAINDMKPDSAMDVGTSTGHAPHPAGAGIPSSPRALVSQGHCHENDLSSAKPMRASLLSLELNDISNKVSDDDESLSETVSDFHFPIHTSDAPIRASGAPSRTATDPAPVNPASIDCQAQTDNSAPVNPAPVDVSAPVNPSSVHLAAPEDILGSMDDPASIVNPAPMGVTAPEDVSALIDVPGPVDNPAPMDVPAPIDDSNPIDVPAPVDDRASINDLATIDNSDSMDDVPSAVNTDTVESSVSVNPTSVGNPTLVSGRSSPSESSFCEISESSPSEYSTAPVNPATANTAPLNPAPMGVAALVDVLQLQPTFQCGGSFPAAHLRA